MMRTVVHVRVRRHAGGFRLSQGCFFRSLERRQSCRKAMAGGRYDGAGGWVVTADKVHAIVRRLREAGFDVGVDDDALALYERRDVELVHDRSLVRDRLRRLDDAFRRAGRSLYPFQMTGAAWLAERERALLGDDQGLGKAQPIDEPVLTPEGWREIGSLRVGDRVIGRDGLPSNVTGVFPRGRLPVYRVRSADGCETRASGDHLWCVQTTTDRARRRYRVLNTSELVTRGLRTAYNGLSRAKATTGQRVVVEGHRFFLPVPEPVRLSPRSFDVDPYLLGALLANAAFGSSIVHSGGVDQREEMAPLLPPEVSIRPTASSWDTILETERRGHANPLVRAIKRLGLFMTESHERFVPSEYLLGSVEQRLALLQGLLDNDGTVSSDGSVVEYNTTSTRLAQDVVYLVRSLGGVARVSTRVPHYVYKGERLEGRVDHRIRVSLAGGLCPFRLPRKVERFRPRTKYPPARPIASIEPDGEAECVCIALDAHDHLYVTRDFVVTHNTVQILAALPEAAPAIVVCPASLKGGWAAETLRWRPSHVATVLSGSESFRWPRSGEIVVLNYDVLPDPHGAGCVDRLPELDDKADGGGRTAEGAPERTFDEIVAGSVRRATERAREPCRGCAPFLAEAPSGVVLVSDEVHWLKNERTRRASRFRSLGAAVRARGGRTWGASGTPLENRPSELWHVLDALDLAREAYGSYTMFVELHGGKTRRLGDGRYAGVSWDASRIKPEAPERLAAVCLRRLKRDVLPELPPKEWRTVRVEVDREALEYVDREMRGSGLDADAVLRAIEDGREEIVFSKLSAGRAALAAAKTKALVEYVRDEYEANDEPVVVFSAHLGPIQALARRPGWAAIVGEVSAKKRTRIVEDFQAGRLKGLGLTYGAGAEGLTLTRAWNLVRVDRPWTVGKANQASDRIHRIGQMAPRVVYTDLVCDHPIDRRVTEVLVEKERTIELAVDAAAVRAS